MVLGEFEVMRLWITGFIVRKYLVRSSGRVLISNPAAYEG